MKRWVLILLTVILGGGGLSLLGIYHYDNYLSTPILSEPGQRKVVIPKGTDMAMAIEILNQEQVIGLPLYFKLHAISTGKGKRIRPGVYYFDLTHTPADIMDELTKGPSVPYLKITIPEGTNIWGVAKIIENSELATAEEFFLLAKDCDWLRSLGAKLPESEDRLFCLEGYMFPETYFVEPGQTLKDLIEVMVKQTQKELRAAKKNQLAKFAKVLHEFHYNNYQLLTLASLVETEVKLTYEKKLVASVFFNRIRKGMPLQTDPTLTYTLKRRGAKPTKKDRQNAKNRYNTYEYQGLPPGPIGNPGREAIEAIVAPAQSRFFYFVAKRDGTGGHHFSITYKEHLRAVKKYLQGK
jgi:peptidoglycan lytic transglycosylase G